MSFIDKTYFIGEINIPPPDAASAALTNAITQYEKEILIQLLGYKTYSLMIADLVDGDPQTQKFIDLVDGAEFDHVYNGETITLEWEGLRNTSLQSLIAYYTFYKFVERDVTRLYPAGVGVSKEGDAWQRANPVYKLVAVWERMRELYGKYPYKTLSVKGEYITPFDCSPSALNFLIANKDDYPDWIFTPQYNINVFGI